MASGASSYHFLGTIRAQTLSSSPPACHVSASSSPFAALRVAGNSTLLQLSHLWGCDGLRVQRLPRSNSDNAHQFSHVIALFLVGAHSKSSRSAVRRIRVSRLSPASGGRANSVDHQPYGIPEKRSAPTHWDVVGLAQAMVDFSGMVDDEFLKELGLEKGVRKVVDHEERGRVLQALDGCSYKVSAGGSLSNTLVALARLGAASSLSAEISPSLQQQQAMAAAFGSSRAGTTASSPSLPLNVAMAGSVGSDPLGRFFGTKLLRAGVHFLSRPIEGGTTGTVVVLTTPDAQRTMLAYQGMSSYIAFDPALEAAIARSRVFLVEGYLWELPQTIATIIRACRFARSRGAIVGLTASDVFCVLNHRKQFWEAMCESTILFANADEARALAGFSSSSSLATAARHLSRFCPLVSVTDGAAGSYLGLRGEEVVYTPPHPCAAIDTCGAGDAHAAGLLYALLQGAPDLRSMGAFAARVASVVVSQQGARLKEADADALAGGVSSSRVPMLEGKLVRRMLGLQSETERSPSF